MNRNKVIIDRETVIEESHIEKIIVQGTKTILLHKEDKNLSDF